MKEGWTYKKLGEVCDYSIGLTYKPTDICDNGTIVLRSSNIQNGQIDLNDIVRVSCPIKDTLFVNKGDILMCSRNGSARLVGKVAIIPDIKERMTYGTFMMIIRSDYNPFLFYYFNSDIFIKQIKHGEANMINQITRYMLDDVVVSLPPLSDQQRIVSRLDAAFSHIDELKVNAEKRLSDTPPGPSFIHLSEVRYRFGKLGRKPVHLTRIVGNHAYITRYILYRCSHFFVGSGSLFRYCRKVAYRIHYRILYACKLSGHF